MKEHIVDTLDNYLRDNYGEGMSEDQKKQWKDYCDELVPVKDDTYEGWDTLSHAHNLGMEQGLPEALHYENIPGFGYKVGKKTNEDLMNEAAARIKVLETALAEYANFPDDPYDSHRKGNWYEVFDCGELARLALGKKYFRKHPFTVQSKHPSLWRRVLTRLKYLRML